MQRKHMTPEEVERAMQETFKWMKTPEGQKTLEEAKKSKFQLKVFGKDNLDLVEEIERERMSKEKK